MAMDKNAQAAAANTTPGANIPPAIDPTNMATGLAPDSPSAKQAMDDLMASRGNLQNTARSAIGAMAAGAEASKGALSPLAAFMQGAQAGLQVPGVLFAQKKKELQETIDASPFAIAYPELAGPGMPYANLGGFPTKLAKETIQTIAADAARIQADSQAKKGQMQYAAELATVDAASAPSYANMANQAFGLTGPSAIQPEELVGMRKEDVDNFIKLRSGSGSGADTSLKVNTGTAIEQAEPGLLGVYSTAPFRKNPYYKLPDKVAMKVREADVKKAESTVSKIAEEANASVANANELRIAQDLLANGKVNTGPIVEGMRINKLRSGDTQTFARIVEKTVPIMRQGMPGAASDRDVAMFRGATIGLDKDEKTNLKIIDQALAISKRIEDKARFMANFKNVYGDINGAEAEYQRFANSKPLFNNDGTVNTENLTSDAFFKANAADAPLSEAERARLQELRAKAGK